MHAVLQQLAGGQLTAGTIAIWTLLGLLLSIAAGALSGVTLAGKDLGTSLAAMMGAMFGPVAAAPGILVALIILAWV